MGIISKPACVLHTIRNEIIDEQFFGFVNLYENKKNIFKIGEDKEGKFFMRSLAKPFQASIMADFQTHKFFDMKEDEIAICTSSHSGDEIHTNILRNLLAKAGLDEIFLKCKSHKPIGNHKNELPINNNCSGKHTLMLLISKQNGWDLENYLDFSHPIQIKIREKIENLCETKDLVSSLDGCGAPIYALPFQNISNGFFNFVNDEKYNFIIQAALNNPIIFGGENRQDSLIISNGNKKLFAKVGAGGFLGIFNIVKNKFLLIKMAQTNDMARFVLAQNLLLNLKWIDKKIIDENIFNLHNALVARYNIDDKFKELK